MLGKLIKYDFKSLSRIFIPIYIAIVVTASINRIFREIINTDNVIVTISTLTLVILFMMLGAGTIIVIIQQFNKNLLGDQGYLMFTLPVNSSELIFSKVIASLIWSCLSGITIMITTFILLTQQELVQNFTKDFTRMWRVLEAKVWNEMHITAGMFIFIVGIIMVMVYINFVLEIYLALATAQLPIFSRCRTIIGLVAYLFINIIKCIYMFLADHIIPTQWVADIDGMIIYSIVLLGIAGAILFLAIKYILNNHLNLE